MSTGGTQSPFLQLPLGTTLAGIPQPSIWSALAFSHTKHQISHSPLAPSASALRLLCLVSSCFTGDTTLLSCFSKPLLPGEFISTFYHLLLRTKVMPVPLFLVLNPSGNVPWKGCFSSDLDPDSPGHQGVSCPGVPSRRSGSAGPQGRTRRQSWRMKLHTCLARATSWVLPHVRWVCQSPSASLALSQGHHSPLEHLSLPGTQPVPSIKGCILDTPLISPLISARRRSYT